jgi:osmotically-inducible protein OsmY
MEWSEDMRLLSQVACEVTPGSQAVAARANRCLQESAYMAIRSVSCKYDQDVLFLRGRLTSYYEKQVAQEAVRDLEGVVQVVNQIEVSEELDGRVTQADHFQPGR